MIVRRRIPWVIALTLCTTLPVAGELAIRGRTDDGPLHLTGPDDCQQLAVTLPSGGQSRDVTRSVRYAVEPTGVVTVDPQGYVTPLANGKATIQARLAGKQPAGASLSVEVTNFEMRRPISFPYDIVPILTRTGCNGGGCHGRPSGQNNFRLSLLGFEPLKDHEFLLKESRGRRISPAAPGQSLFLQKACGDMPHQGGVRLDKQGAEYAILARWIARGFPYAPAEDPQVERIEIHPGNRVVAAGSSQQLVITAVMSDGTRRDITRAVEYKPNQEHMADVDHHGLVRFKKDTGTTSVMVRFQDHVGVFRALIPLGERMEDLPTPRNFIDEHVFAKLRVLGLPPSPACDDATFLRRVTLDIAGRLPTLAETGAFLASKDPQKRAHRIDTLLEDPGYAELFAGKWAGILRNKAATNLEQVSRETFAFHDWIRDSLRHNKPYDRFVTELVTARGKAGVNPAISWYRAVSDQKDRMADIAQVFLGVRIQCAQCHHHPYEKWSQDDYYSFAAFFSTVARKEVRKLPESDVVYHKRVVATMKNPNTDQILKPTPLDKEPLDIPAERDPRLDLAAWMTGPENPFFATMLVNRYWKHFFTRGLVEPEDDIRVTNPATHPELLQALAGHFIRSGYDLKDLVRTLCNSRTYQLSSTPDLHNADDGQNYARHYPNRLPAEVMLDAINQLTGARNSFSRQPVGVRAIALPDDSFNRQSEFLTVFGRPQMDSACECERATEANLAQSLHLINSDTIQALVATPEGRAATLAKAKEQSDDGRIRELYLQALCREPRPDELDIARKHLARKRERSAADPKERPAEQAEREAFEDIIWVLMNTKEFLFNH